MLPMGLEDDAYGLSLGYTGVLFSLFMFFSPVPTMVQIIEEKSILHFSEVPYVVSMWMCFIWISYGFATPGRTIPLISNLIGLACQLTYGIIFVVYSNGRNRSRIQFRLIASFVTLVTFVWFSFYVAPWFQCLSVSTIIGATGCLVNVAMYASPLEAVGQVIRTRSVEFLPLSLSITMMCNSLVWSAFSIYVGDLFLAIPNICGIALSLLQLLLYFLYQPGGQLTRDLLKPVEDSKKYGAIGEDGTAPLRV